MDALSPWHLLILAGIFVLLFGARKLPEAARALGRSMRIFKAETQGLRGDDTENRQAAPAVAYTASQAPASPGTLPQGTVMPQGAMSQTVAAQPQTVASQQVTVPETQQPQQSG